MIKRLSLLCLLLMTFLYSCDQKTNTSLLDSKNDSIKKYLDLAGDDNYSFKEKERFANKAYSFINLNNNDTVTINNIFKINRIYYAVNKWDTFLKLSNITLKKSLYLNDSIRIACSYRYIDLYYIYQSQNEKALHYAFKAKKIYETIKYYKNLSSIYSDISQIQNFSCDFLGSTVSAIKGLKFAKNTSEIRYLNTIIAINSDRLNNYNKALEYYNKALMYTTTENEKFILLNSIGIVYVNQKKYLKGNVCFEKIIKNKKNLVMNPLNYASALDYYSYTKFKLGNLSNLPKLFFKAEEIRAKNNPLDGSNYNQLFLSEYYSSLKKDTEAIKCAKKALELSKSYNNPDNILACLKQLINVDKKKASKYAQEYIRINDSMQIAERLFRDKFARIAYETDEITKQKNTAIKQNWIITSVAISILLVMILVFVIYRQNSKRKELELLQSHQNANEKIYQLMLIQKTSEEEIRQTEKKRIAQELHDGVMNKLASTRLNLSILSDKNDPKTIKKCIGYIADIFRIEQEIRGITHNMNQNMFKKSNSYYKLLFDFIKEQNTVSETNYTLELNQEIDWVNISSEIKMNLYRIIQEASHNINKHARAKKAIISVVLDGKNICLSVTDNGIGFCPLKKKEGIGIQNIEQRVKKLNGTIIINSVSNKSTAINIAIPI